MALLGEMVGARFTVAVVFPLGALFKQKASDTFVME